jgi:hypothetical protein
VVPDGLYGRVPCAADTVVLPSGSLPPTGPLASWDDQIGVGVSPQEIFALLRRHAVAIAAVVVLVGTLGIYLERRPPGYADSATVAFVAPKNQGGLFGFGQSLLVADQVMTASLSGPQGQEQVRKAGGTAKFSVELVNLSDEEFPNYSDPYATVSVVSQDAGEAEKTYSAVIQVLQEDLAAIQARQGAKPNTWIHMHIIADSPAPGAQAQRGSRDRIFAGLAILGVIAAFMLATFLDRRPIRWRGSRMP